MQRKIDRQRRSSNPDNYLPDGKIKKGRKTWKKSAHQAKCEAELAERERRTAAHRKSLHGKLSNEIIRMGNVFKTEAISGKWLQKSFGKSVKTRAPKMFISMTERKAESAGATFVQFPTVTTKLSQTCVCGRVKKKDFSERAHVCGCGVRSQRDLFFAFLAIFVEGGRVKTINNSRLATPKRRGRVRTSSCGWLGTKLNMQLEGFDLPPSAARAAGVRAYHPTKEG